MTRRPLLRIAAVLTASVLLLSGLSSVETPRAQAVDLSRFNPGLIITDRNFTDWSSMNAASIQAFLDARNPSCRPGNDGTPCLRAAVFDTWTRPADNRCRGTYVGAARESAATIIAKVAQACEISPKVLLVLLQKEQSLVTATGTSLTASRYRSATGFGCPDTAPCDAQYYGFYNQVYHAAWQFRNYTLYPERYNHRAGVVNNIRFHPNAACGSSPVRIQNQSTANLYNYTPYQPNAASLAAGSGTGDACSSYGNRNFYRFYTDWFGRPDAGDPIGAVESITATMSSITVSGWAIDPATNVSNQVHIYVSSVGYAVNANLPRPDVGAVFGMGPERGFSATFPASPGRHAVCTYSIGVERPQVTLLGCRTVDVVNRPPMGVIDAVAINEGQLTVAGWAFDPDSPGSTDVHVYVNGVGVAVRANLLRPDVGAVYGRGPENGFAYTRSVGAGPQTVCVYAIDTAGGPASNLGCRTVQAVNRPPMGVIDAVAINEGQLTVAGWAFDPDSPGSTDVHVYVNGVGVAVRANLLRPDVGAVYGRGPENGFAYTRSVGAGPQTVCVYAIDTAGGPASNLGCRTVTG